MNASRDISFSGIHPVDTHRLKQELKQGIEKLGLTDYFENSTLNPFIHFMELMLKWNRSYNLTAVRKPAEIIRRHFLDCLAVLPFIKGERIIDVGSGAGLPGIPLALSLPNKSITLLDANGKKARFLLQVKNELALDNVMVVHDRVESIPQVPSYDVIITRAFGNMADIVEKTQKICYPGGEILAMKGVYPQTELKSLQQKYQVHRLEVPFVDGERHLICVENAST